MSGTKKRLCLVDGNSYIHRAYHAIRELRNSRGLPTNAIYGFLSMITKVLKDEKPDLVAVVFDAGGKTIRHELYPEYKANRPKMPDDLLVQVDYIKRLTSAFGLPFFEREGVEADDLLATLGRRARKQGLEVTFITGDKDIQQLIDEHTDILDTMKDRRLGLKSFVEEHGFEPSRLVEFMALAGDSSDNIPGVPGIGPKTAEKLIREYGTLENLYSHLDKLPEGRTRELLRQHRKQAELSRRLASLEDDVEAAADWKEITPPAPDKKSLKNLLEELEFKKFLRELDLGEAGAEAALETEVVDKPDRVRKWLESVDRSRPLTLVLAHDGGGFTSLAQDMRQVVLAPLPGEKGPAAKSVEILRRLLEDLSLRKWGFDFKDLLHRCRRLGIKPRGLDLDVLIAAYLLNPSEKGNTLDDLALTYLGVSTAPEAKTGVQQALFAPGEELKLKAVREAAIIHRLGSRLGPELEKSGMGDLYREVELPLVGVLCEMEDAGIAVDLEALGDMSKEMEIILGRTEEEIYTLAGTSFNIGSPKQLAEILFGKLNLPVIKKTKTGNSTDEEVLTILAASHQLPSLLLSYRQLAKLKNTYVDVLPGLVAEDGRVHTTFNQAVTATGRLSSSGPNLQNIPVRTEWGQRIRRSFVPRPGWKFISADYSQIELRVLAHLSGDETLIESFRKGEDIHARTAREIFRLPAGEVTKEMRRAAKVINFGIIYGMSPYGLSRELSVDQKKAKTYIDDYFSVYRGVRRYLDGLVAQAKKDGYVSTFFGRRRYLRELQSDKSHVVQFAERAALNTPIQGTAADLIKMAMIELHRRLASGKLKTVLLVQIHDELLLEAPPAELETAAALVKKCMEGAASFRVPIVADVAAGDNWGELH